MVDLNIILEESVRRLIKFKGLGKRSVRFFFLFLYLGFGFIDLFIKDEN